MPSKKRRNRPHIPDPPPPGLPIVAVVGRPNVGKSTLYNRLTGTRRAAVIDTPGITRDRQYGRAEWGDRSFIVVDTGGYDPEPGKGAIALNDEIREQALLAVDEADVVVFVLDVLVESHPVDQQLADLLRKSGRPVVVAINKAEAHARFQSAYGFSALGLGEVFPISALHGEGTGDLMDALLDVLPPAQEDEFAEVPDDERPIRLAVVGRQNVGKSTLVNRLLGRERVIASSVAGTTRDAIDTAFTTPDGQRWVLIDTAGIRRRGKIDQGIEGLSVISSLMSMERSDVAVLMIDGVEGLTDQDKHIAGYAVERGCSLIIGVNKWDAVDKDHRTADKFTKDLRMEMGFAEWAPVLFLSALSGQRADKVWQLAGEVFAESTRRIDTSSLNEWLRKALLHHSPPVRSNRQFRANYVTQTGVRPPTFAIFCNDPKLVHFSYERYLVNSLREHFDLSRVPLRLRFRKKSVDRFKDEGWQSSGERGRPKPSAPKKPKII